MDSLNKYRYFELVAKDEDLKIKGTSLYYENQSEYDELLSYKIILEEQVFYANRFQYTDLIKKYLDGQINCYTFQWDFFDLYHNHGEVYDKFIENVNQAGISSEISFSTNSKKNFYLLINELIPMCNALDDGLTEARFDLEIKKIYSLWKNNKLS
jgi:hypothetical protein